MWDSSIHSLIRLWVNKSLQCSISLIWNDLLFARATSATVLGLKHLHIQRGLLSLKRRNVKQS